MVNFIVALGNQYKVGEYAEGFLTGDGFSTLEMLPCYLLAISSENTSVFQQLLKYMEYSHYEYFNVLVY